jgi:hypothetical protein
MSGFPPIAAIGRSPFMSTRPSLSGSLIALPEPFTHEPGPVRLRLALDAAPVAIFPSARLEFYLVVVDDLEVEIDAVGMAGAVSRGVRGTASPIWADLVSSTDLQLLIVPLRLASENSPCAADLACASAREEPINIKAPKIRAIVGSTTFRISAFPFKGIHITLRSAQRRPCAGVVETFFDLRERPCQRCIGRNGKIMEPVIQHRLAFGALDAGVL